MSYNVDYTLEMQGAKEFISVLLAHDPHLTDYQRFSDIFYSPQSEGNFYYCHLEYQWRTLEDDMVFLSMKFPYILFIIKTYGEDQPDIEVHYFKNGRHETYEAQITFPPPTHYLMEA